MRELQIGQIYQLGIYLYLAISENCVARYTKKWKFFKIKDFSKCKLKIRRKKTVKDLRIKWRISLSMIDIMISSKMTTSMRCKDPNRNERARNAAIPLIFERLRTFKNRENGKLLKI